MADAQNMSYTIAFTAGVLSFFSPCVFPLIPSYISYMTGVSFEDLKNALDRGKIRRITAINSFFFIAGFSTIFVLLGASSSAIGRMLLEYQDTIRKVGGILVIIFGLYIAGILRLGFLSRERRFHLRDKPLGFLGSFFVGIIFSAGWTPCVGPILASILLYASTAGSVSYGIKLLTVFSLGLGIPFFIAAIGINSLLLHFRRIQRYLRIISVISGVFLIIVGILIFTNYLTVLSYYLTALFGSAGI